MLFTTAQFVLLFLPVALAGFFVSGRRSRTAAGAWLFLASLFFYGWWMPVFTWLLLASIGTNFLVGLRIARSVRDTCPTPLGQLGRCSGLRAWETDLDCRCSRVDCSNTPPSWRGNRNCCLPYSTLP